VHSRCIQGTFKQFLLVIQYSLIDFVRFIVPPFTAGEEVVIVYKTQEWQILMDKGGRGLKRGEGEGAFLDRLTLCRCGTLCCP